MKRRTLRFMACAAVMALTLSVTACGGSDDGAKTNDTAQVEDTADVTASEPEEKVEAEPEVEDVDVTEVETEIEDAEDDEYFDTLEEAFAQPEVKEAMDEQLAAMDMEGMEISYEVTGNEFTVNYKVIGTVIDDPADFAEQMEPVMEQLAPVFSAFAEMFDEALGQEGATTVTVCYFDDADTLLIEHSYTAVE